MGNGVFNSRAEYCVSGNLKRKKTPLEIFSKSGRCFSVQKKSTWNVSSVSLSHRCCLGMSNKLCGKCFIRAFIPGCGEEFVIYTEVTGFYSVIDCTCAALTESAINCTKVVRVNLVPSFGTDSLYKLKNTQDIHYSPKWRSLKLFLLVSDQLMEIVWWARARLFLTILPTCTRGSGKAVDLCSVLHPQYLNKELITPNK